VRVLETEKKNVRAVGIGGIFSVSNPANCHYLLSEHGAEQIRYKSSSF
jgi:hypothetical protein